VEDKLKTGVDLNRLLTRSL